MAAEAAGQAALEDRSSSDEFLQVAYLLKTQLFNGLYVCNRFTSPGLEVLRGKVGPWISCSLLLGFVYFLGPFLVVNQHFEHLLANLLRK